MPHNDNKTWVKMPISAQINMDNSLAQVAANAPRHIVQAVHSASRETGVDFGYLLQQAKAESSFRADAKAKTSSATGLYQFIESTWLDMVKNHGEKHGLAEFAKNITATSNGRLSVSDTQTRENILALRNDPKKASLLAAELAADNKRHLEQHVGGDIGATELYFAHFMGANGASNFLNARKDNPFTSGAQLFPKEAKANPGVFYDNKTGRARTLEEIYGFFDKKFQARPVTQKPKVETPLAIAQNDNHDQAVLNAMALAAEQATSQAGLSSLRSYTNKLQSPVEVMLMAQLSMPDFTESDDRYSLWDDDKQNKGYGFGP